MIQHEHHLVSVFSFLPLTDQVRASVSPPPLFIPIFLQSSDLPCLLLAFRTKLTGAAEKESIAMFVRNLRQRLLLAPVRGTVIMGVDPGYKHGCKLAILSPTSKSPQTTADISFHNVRRIAGYRFRCLTNKSGLSISASGSLIPLEPFLFLTFLVDSMVFRSDSAHRYFLPP